MARQLARQLTADHHEVTMIVPFPNRPHGRLYDGYRRSLLGRSEELDGFRIRRCACWLIGRRRRAVSRLLENLTFGVSSMCSAWSEGRPDVLIAETWPLFATHFAVFLARWWRVPLLYYVQDVYPEAAERVGFLKSGSAAARLCRRWDRFICESSAKVIVISESMRDLMATGRALSKSRFTVIPNWLDAQEFTVQPVDNVWRVEQGIPTGTFVAMYGGTLGLVSGVGILIEVAQLLRDRPDVLIFCVGEGVEKARMMDQAETLGLRNIRFLPFQPRKRVPEVQGAANVMLLTMQPGYSNASVPSKLISYMAAGRAVICAAPVCAAVSEVVTDSGAGLVTEAGDAPAMAEAIRHLAGHPAETADMGRRARIYFDDHFTVDRAHRQFSELLQDIQGVESKRI